MPDDPGSLGGRSSVRSTRIVHDGWGRFLVARLAVPDGTDIEREIEDHGSAVAVLPYDPDRRIVLLVRQLRPPALYAAGLQDMLEAPAGRLDSADPQACARREVWEEVGVRLGALDSVGTVWAMPAVSTERLHLFLAPFGRSDRIGMGGGLVEERETIVVVELALAELGRMIAAGEMTDLKTLALAQALQARRPDLFA